jgi:hypothetical protein
MALNIEPEIGSWYMNMTGQLIKVWAVAYAGKQLSNIVIEYLNGDKRIISCQDWKRLDLEAHLYQSAHRSSGS